MAWTLPSPCSSPFPKAFSCCSAAISVASSDREESVTKGFGGLGYATSSREVGHWATLRGFKLCPLRCLQQHPSKGRCLLYNCWIGRKKRAQITPCQLLPVYILQGKLGQSSGVWEGFRMDHTTGVFTAITYTPFYILASSSDSLEPASPHSFSRTHRTYLKCQAKCCVMLFANHMPGGQEQH